MSAAVFVDSHVHLADPAFTDDVDAVVERARAAGARALVCIGESPETALRAQALAARHTGFVFHTCGLHPHAAAAWNPLLHPEAIRAAARHGAVAVGECGLDYHYDNAPREQQRLVLAAQLQLAAGWYVSFSGIITFKSWTDEALLKAVPDDRLLIESDAPYLAPVPYRGKRNESAFVARTLEKLAAVRGTSAEVLGFTALANTQRLFALPPSLSYTDITS